LKKLFWKKDNVSGIFNWLAEGYRMLQAEGLATPERVVSAVTEYRLNSDGLGMFFAENLIPTEGNRLKSSVLNKLYNEWTKIHGYPKMTSPDFWAELCRRFEHTRDCAKGNVIIGFDLKK